MVLASSIYNIIYVYRVYVDSHSLGQLALASKRTASCIIFRCLSPGESREKIKLNLNQRADSDSEIVYLTFICQVTVHHTNNCIQCQETPIKTISCR